MLTFLHLRKIYSRRSFVSIISRARMDGRGPWQHRDEVARTLAQRSNTFLYKWTLWQRRKTEQSVKSSQDTACNKMGQSEWLVIDQHIHLPRPIFTFLCHLDHLYGTRCSALLIMSCPDRREGEYRVRRPERDVSLQLLSSDTNTQIHKYTNTNKSDDQSGRDVTLQLLSTEIHFHSGRHKHLEIFGRRCELLSTLSGDLCVIMV